MTRKQPSAEELAREKVIRRIYDDALRLDWEHLSMPERSKQYERWIDDPHVGGVLEQWKDREGLRVWLKDVPMKEFSRALAGEGDFAKHLDEHPHSVSSIIARGLGDGWTVVQDSVEVKPLQCIATKGDVRRWVAWGNVKDFKNLLYAALLRWDANKSEQLLIVVHDSIASPIRDATRAQYERLAAKVGISFKTIRL